MASPGELIKRTSDVLSIPEVKVASYYRYLRQAGLVSKKGRGVHAAQMTPKDSVPLIIACGGSRIERDNAVDSVEAYSQLRASHSAHVHYSPPAEWVDNDAGTWIFEGLSLPHLQALPEHHGFTAALGALIEASMNREYSSSVSNAGWKPRYHIIEVFFYGPKPRAKISIELAGSTDADEYFNWKEEATYLLPDEIQDNIASTPKTRKKRDDLNVKHGVGDLSICRSFTQETIHAIADILLKT